MGLQIEIKHRKLNFRHVFLLYKTNAAISEEEWNWRDFDDDNNNGEMVKVVGMGMGGI